MNLPYDLMQPEQWRGGLIVASPHSGRAYPDGFVARSRLDIAQLRSSEDAFVDQLAGLALSAGAVVLNARIARTVVDLNRACDDLDPLVVEGLSLPSARSTRALAGLGVIPRVVAQGRPIFDRPMARADADRLIACFWRPYHQRLAALMDEAVARFGRAILIDLHSMPRAALRHLSPRPEAVLGDRHGQSAGRWIRMRLLEALRAEGLMVRVNTPFAGAYVAETYGRPDEGRHVLQLELDRSLYMDEARLEPHGGFPLLAARLGRVFMAAQGGNEAMAAE